MNGLELSLKKFLELLDNTTRAEVIICGSMSTYLQGSRITPNDIDVLAGSRETVEHIAELMGEYEVDESPS